MDQAKKKVSGGSHTRSIAFVGLSIAIMAVSAWVTVPLGAIPLTLQMFAFSFAILVLTPKQCIAAVAGYLALGAVGVPVFSGMRGGIGVLAGTTGGYLWGYLLGAAAAILVISVLRSRLHISESKMDTKSLVVDVVGCLAFVAVAYVCGWAQYMAVAGVGPVASFAATVAPFIVIDFVKVVAAAICARAVRAALPKR